MAKNNTIIDDSNNEVIYYGCASIQDALDLSQSSVEVDNPQQLLNYGSVYKKEPNLGVQIIEPTNSGIIYQSDEQIVAYKDLSILSPEQNLKIGVCTTNKRMLSPVVQTHTSNFESEIIQQQYNSGDLIDFHYSRKIECTNIAELSVDFSNMRHFVLINGNSVNLQEWGFISTGSAVLYKNGVKQESYNTDNDFFISYPDNTNITLEINTHIYLENTSDLTELTIEYSNSVDYTTQTNKFVGTCIPLTNISSDSHFYHPSSEIDQCILSEKSQYIEEQDSTDIYFHLDKSKYVSLGDLGACFVLTDFANIDVSNIQIKSVDFTNNYYSQSFSTTQSSDRLENFYFKNNIESFVLFSRECSIAVCTTIPYEGVETLDSELQNKQSIYIALVGKIDNFDGHFATINVVYQYEYLSSVYERTTSLKLYISKEQDNIIEEDTNVYPESNTLYTFLYKTSDNTEINITDNQWQTISQGNQLLNHGYSILSEVSLDPIGWVLFKDPITVFDGRNVFANNTKLTYIQIPSTVQEISYDSFLKCINLKTIDFCDNTQLYRIGENSFRETGIQQLNFPSRRPRDDGKSATFIFGVSCFSYCKQLTSIQFSGDYDYIHFYELSFYECSNLKTVNGSFKISSFGNSAFENCSNLTTDLTFYANEEERLIGEACFKNCKSLTRITLPLLYTHSYMREEAFIVNEYSAFENCTELKTIYMKGNYKGTLGFAKKTFLGCKNVEKIYCWTDCTSAVSVSYVPYMGAKNIWKAGAINPQTCKVYIPSGVTSGFNNSPQWGDFPRDSFTEYSDEQFAAIWPTTG